MIVRVVNHKEPLCMVFLNLLIHSSLHDSVSIFFFLKSALHLMKLAVWFSQSESALLIPTFFVGMLLMMEIFVSICILTMLNMLLLILRALEQF